MENGYVILGIVALLFLSMYGYAYLSVANERANEKKKLKDLVEKEKIRKLKRLKNQEIIDAKVRAFNKRKEEIHNELLLLKKMKEKLKVS